MPYYTQAARLVKQINPKTRNVDGVKENILSISSHKKYDLIFAIYKNRSKTPLHLLAEQVDYFTNRLFIFISKTCIIYC